MRRRAGIERELASRAVQRVLRHRPFLLHPVIFRTDLPCYGGYHLEMDGMPLYDVVGIM